MQAIALQACPGTGAAPCIFAPTGIAVGDISVVRCGTCGLGVTLPEIDDIASLYANRESWDFQPRTSALALAIKRIAFRARARSFLSAVPGKPNVIADYGCGSGLFTSCVQEVSGAQVHALDFHDEAPAELDGPRYLPFGREGELAGKADVLIASHVLEHEIDPVALVARMAALVRPGGHLVIEVPNVACWGADVFGAKWDGWYLPFHRLHFSRASLRAAVERAGLEVVDERGASVPTMGRTLANLFGRENNLAFLLAGALLQPVQWVLEKLTGKPSALRVTCRKR